MSKKAKSRVINAFTTLLLLSLGVLWVLWLPVPNFLFQPYDSARLALFNHRIASADRVVATYAQSTMSLTLKGEDVRKLMSAVSSASSDRPPWGRETSCSFMCHVAFLSGTNVLDDISVCDSSFLIGHRLPPFRDDSGLLGSMVYSPITKAAYDAEMERLTGVKEDKN